MRLSRVINILPIFELATLANYQHLMPKSDPRDNPDPKIDSVHIHRDIAKRFSPGQYSNHMCHGECNKNPYSQPLSSNPSIVEVENIPISTNKKRNSIDEIMDDGLGCSPDCNGGVSGAKTCGQKRGLEIGRSSQRDFYNHEHSISRAAFIMPLRIFSLPSVLMEML